MEPLILRDTERYRVTYYPRSPRLLVIVFVSAGRLASGEPAEEFKRTLDGFDVSTLFVVDKNSWWFNHPESPAMWSELAMAAAQHDRVVTLGDSMGACGAILAHKELDGVDRTLALSPQHSILKPFVDFDARYDWISRQIPEHRYIHFSDAPEPGRCVVLFGNREWRDYLHSAMFRAHGFDPIYIEGVGHNLAPFLKAQPGNGLKRLVGALLDWERPFDRAAVEALFPELVSTVGMHPGESFASEATGHNHSLMTNLETRHRLETGAPIGSDLAAGKAASQSSLSPWSRGTTREADAAEAVAGPVTGNYAFHTRGEERPWWQVDLGGSSVIREVRLFNYLAHPEVMGRAARVELLVSPDGQWWTPVFRRTEPGVFGGADGYPLIWRPGAPLVARFLRVSLPGHSYLHLDKVQVFGHPA